MRKRTEKLLNELADAIDSLNEVTIPNDNKPYVLEGLKEKLPEEGIQAIEEYLNGDLSIDDLSGILLEVSPWVTDQSIQFNKQLASTLANTYKACL